MFFLSFLSASIVASQNDVHTCYQGVLGEVLEEALCLATIHVEVKGVGGNQKREDREESQNGSEP
jgi:hypothetical protein